MKISVENIRPTTMTDNDTTTPVNDVGDGRPYRSSPVNGDDDHACFIFNIGIFRSCLGASLLLPYHRMPALIQTDERDEQGVVDNYHCDTHNNQIDIVNGRATSTGSSPGTSRDEATSLSISTSDGNRISRSISSIESSTVVEGMQLKLGGRSPSSSLSSSPLSSPLSNLQVLVLPLNREQAWEELEDDLCLILTGNTDRLLHFHKLHKEGLIWSNLIRSLAYLASRPKKGTCTITNSDRLNCSGNDGDHYHQSTSSSHYYEHISAVASFFAVSKSIPRKLKLASLRTVMACLSPVEAAWQVQDTVVEGTFEFLVNRKAEWEYMEHSEMVLVWELRAMCLRQLEREQERVNRVAATGDTAVIYISGGAKLLEAGMARSVPLISDSIDSVGRQVKTFVQPDACPILLDRDAVVALTYSDALKRVSEGAKESSRIVVEGLRQVSSKGVSLVASQLENGNLGERLLPHPESREAIKVVGKVGMAAIGAAAIVGEAVVETSRAVAVKTASATADVVQYKYGTSAGQVVRDAGDTASNILRAVGNVALLESKVLAKSVARNSGKVQVEDEISKAKDSIRLLEEQAVGFVQHTIAGMSSGGAAQLDGSIRFLEAQALGFVRQSIGGDSSSNIDLIVAPTVGLAIQHQQATTPTRPSLEEGQQQQQQPGVAQIQQRSNSEETQRRSPSTSPPPRKSVRQQSPGNKSKSSTKRKGSNHSSSKSEPSITPGSSFDTSESSRIYNEELLSSLSSRQSDTDVIYRAQIKHSLASSSNVPLDISGDSTTGSLHTRSSVSSSSSRSGISRISSARRSSHTRKRTPLTPDINLKSRRGKTVDGKENSHHRHHHPRGTPRRPSHHSRSTSLSSYMMVTPSRDKQQQRPQRSEVSPWPQEHPTLMPSLC